MQMRNGIPLLHLFPFRSVLLPITPRLHVSFQSNVVPDIEEAGKSPGGGAGMSLLQSFLRLSECEAENASI